MTNILIVLTIIACGMIGGQCNKWIRRYLLPFIVIFYTRARKGKKKFKSLLFLPLIGILSMGYGENSKLRKLLMGNDIWTRVVYGLLVSVPFVFFGKWYAAIALPIAYSIRAGGFKITETKQFLIEDFIRFLTIGLLVVI